MDKAKGVLKGGWHPAGDPKVHRDTWKSDLKGIATGKTPEKKQLEASRNHQSVPLSSLKDPDSFAPPPKHTSSFGSAPSTPTSATRAKPPAGGLGAPVPAPRWKQEAQEVQEEKPAAPALPYRTDTTGLRTDNLPKPPARREDLAAPPPPVATSRSPVVASPTVPARQLQPAPQQQQPQSRPVPTLPPRMNEHPDEFTPPAPPSYNEATHPPVQNPAILNSGAINRLTQAGVSVPGFGIGSGAESSSTQPQTNPQGHSGQLSELQQRFARMNTQASSQQSAPQPTSASNAVSSLASAASAVHKKAPPPPPPKRPGIADASGSRPGTGDGADAPPPLPLASKPRPG